MQQQLGAALSYFNPAICSQLRAPPGAGKAELLQAEPSIGSHPLGCRPRPGAAPAATAGGVAPRTPVRSSLTSLIPAHPTPWRAREDAGSQGDPRHCGVTLTLPSPTGFNGAIRIVLVDKSRFVSLSHDSKPRLCSIYKSKSPSCECQAQISAPKAKPGECFQPEREGKSCICKSWETFFYLSGFDKQRGQPVEYQLLKKPDELILHQAT